MSVRVRKTEHSGAKKGQGGYWGPKWVAKAGSNRIRREQGKTEVANAAVSEGELGTDAPGRPESASESTDRPERPLA